MRFHEIGGLVLFALFLLHNALNWKWVKTVSARVFQRGLPPQRSAVQASLAAAGSQGTRPCMSGVSPGFRSLFSHCQPFFRMAQRSFPGQHRNLAEPADPLQRTF